MFGMTFDTTSTADDVLKGLDLSGKHVLVTGASAGIGAELARVLVAHGATVVGTVRDMGKATSVMEALNRQATGNGKLELVSLDLASLSSVRACADGLLEAKRSFAAVIANAGVMAAPYGRTMDGFETQFGTNHLGHFVLVNRIAPLLENGSRVVVVASAGHRGADVDLDDPNFERTPYDPLTSYRRSKTATILFAVAFDERHRTSGVRGTAVHPGAVLTETTQKLIDAQPAAASAFTWKTVAQGAATPVWAALVASADEVGGRYCEDCHVAEIDDNPSARSGVRSYALDQTRAGALWRKSSEMVAEAF